MASIDDKIEALQTRLKQAKAIKAKAEARKRAAEVKAKRANDTRRKILVGSFVLAQMDKGGISASMVTYEGARLVDWLTRDDDRALFGLSSLPKATP